MHQEQSSISFTGFQLKYIALFVMTVDHIGAVLLNPKTTGYVLARSFGRIAFPIFCFLLVEGFFHTSNHINYLKRLFLFAFISEIPFDMAFYNFPVNYDPGILFCHQNVFFTLAFGFLSMSLIERFLNKKPYLSVLSVLGAIFLAQQLRFDYGGFGIMVILLFYGYQRIYPWLFPLTAYVFALAPLLAIEDRKRYFVLLSVPFFLFYHGQKGSGLLAGKKFPGGKYFFYWYYPCHLLLLALIHFIIQ